MRDRIKRIPVVGPISLAIYRVWTGRSRRRQPFSGSSDYWISRYEAGGNSGPGSYNRLAEFKAEILNQFVAEHGVTTVIEYGCGDGNQLALAAYPSYTGFDVSGEAVAMCRKRFSGDANKRFELVGDYRGETAELTLSLDVVYHLVEDPVFESYMRRLFDSATRFVIVYSSNFDKPGRDGYIRHRRFTEWVDENKPEWRLSDHVPNRFPFVGDHRTGSLAEFFFYERA